MCFHIPKNASRIVLARERIKQHKLTIVLVYHIRLARTVRAARDFKTVSENKQTVSLQALEFYRLFIAINIQ